MINDVVDESLRVGSVSMEPDHLAVMGELRDFMFEHVYLAAEMEPQRRLAKDIVRRLVEHFLEVPRRSRRVTATPGRPRSPR